MLTDSLVSQIVNAKEQSMPTPIAVAYGDGIGPEIMSATLSILNAAGARIAPVSVEIGEAVYRRGHSAGIEPGTWDVLRDTKVFLKAPITTPQGGGFKSLNVTVRKTLGLYANVRPCVTYHPFVKTAHPGMDLVIVRENEEDLYAGIEHRQTEEVYQCLKLVSRAGCERIVRYAFDYARSHGRKKVTCMTKDNIMKLTDGLMHKVFDEIGAEYPEIDKEHWIIDIGMARAATRPTTFDVIVTPNLYGDILSDVVAEVAGSVGLAPSANIGEHCAMFEAIHGSAPLIAGRDQANPTGLLLAAVQMLVHIGQPEVATRVHNALLRTIEDGIHTADIYQSSVSKEMVGTDGFRAAVEARLGLLPQTFAAQEYATLPQKPCTQIKAIETQKDVHKETVGVDVFVNYPGSADALAEVLKAAETNSLKLQMITNRGVKVWPNGLPETTCTDHWRCRFITSPYSPIQHREILQVLGAVMEGGLDFIKTENLCTFDGEVGFSLGQGQ